MCSTPRPKRRVSSIKTQPSGAVLANISKESRTKFAQIANDADERRYQQKMTVKKQQTANHLWAKNTSTKKANMQHRSVKKDWLYWLVSASIKEILARIFLPAKQI